LVSFLGEAREERKRARGRMNVNFSLLCAEKRREERTAPKIGDESREKRANVVRERKKENYRLKICNLLIMLLSLRKK
jgi:SLT domain-containing protein